MLKSWKTTLGGILMALGSYFLTQDFAMASFIASVLNAGGALLIGVMARDNSVSSEEAGAK